MISHEIRPAEDTLVAVVIKLMLFVFISVASNMVHMKIVDEPTNYGSVCS